MIFWPENEGVALFYDKDGKFYDQKFIYLPFGSTYLFMEIPNLPGLTIFADPKEIHDEEGAIKRIFRLEYYRPEGNKIFGYYYEKDDE